MFKKDYEYARMDDLIKIAEKLDQHTRQLEIVGEMARRALKRTSEEEPEALK